MASSSLEVSDRVLESLLKANFTESKTKLSNDALVLVKEIVRIESTELVTRACKVAKEEGAKEVKAEHVQTVLPKFMLDFA